jgi:hypothetical protein
MQCFMVTHTYFLGAAPSGRTAQAQMHKRLLRPTLASYLWLTVPPPLPQAIVSPMERCAAMAKKQEIVGY